MEQEVSSGCLIHRQVWTLTHGPVSGSLQFKAHPFVAAQGTQSTPKAQQVNCKVELQTSQFAHTLVRLA
jgi:hypothetical protein